MNLLNGEANRGICDGIRRIYYSREAGLVELRQAREDNILEWRRVANAKLNETDPDRIKFYQRELSGLVKAKERFEHQIRVKEQQLIDYSNDYQLNQCEIFYGQLN